VIIAAILLAIAFGAIIAAVGLSGPDLNTSDHEHDAEIPKPVLPVGNSPGEPKESPKVQDQGAANAQKNKAAPAPTTSRSIKIDSSPTNADVFLDRVFQCKTPCTIEDVEKDRLYLVSLRRKHFVDWSALVDMLDKSTVNVTAYLSEEPNTSKVGYLLVKTKNNWDLLVNKKPINRVTSEGRIPLMPGQYEITLTHPRVAKHHKFDVKIPLQKIVLVTPPHL
jgi:hypothetical protein